MIRENSRNFKVDFFWISLSSIVGYLFFPTTMESESLSTKIEILKDWNYHYWKIQIEHLLILKDWENFLYDDPPTSTPTEIALQRKNDKRL